MTKYADTLNSMVELQPTPAAGYLRAGITSSAPTTVYDTFEVTITFPRLVIGFSIEDLIVSGATLSNFLPLGDRKFLVQVHPVVDGEITLQIPAGAAHDADGIPNSASLVFTRVYLNSLLPRVTLQRLDPCASGAFDVAAVFTESVNAFSLDGIQASNASVSALSGSGTNYQFTVTPSGTGAVGITIAMNAAFSLVTPYYGNAASASYSWTCTEYTGPNQVLWLRGDVDVTADGSNKVSAWANQSGSAVSANQGTPAQQPTLVAGSLNGLPVIHFSAADSSALTIVETPDMRPTNLTWMAVAKGGGSGVIFSRPYYTDSHWGGLWVTQQLSLIQDWFAFYLTVGANRTDIGDDITSSKIGYHLITVRYDGGFLENFADGVNALSQTLVPSGSVDYSELGQAFWIGNNPIGEALEGDIAEIMLFDQALSETDRQTVECYLNGKYNLGLSGC